MKHPKKTIRTDKKSNVIQIQSGTPALRQMSIAECFKKAKMRPPKIEKTLFFSSDEIIVIDSDSDVEAEHSPPKRPKTMASTPRRALNIEDETTLSTSKVSNEPFVNSLPTDSPKSVVSDSSNATLPYEFSGHTFDNSTEPFSGNVLAEVLVLNDPMNFANDNTQNAWDGVLSTNASQGGSIQPAKNGPVAKRRLSFRENNITDGASDVATNNNAGDRAKGNNPRADTPCMKSRQKSGDRNEQPDKKAKAARRPSKKKGVEGAQTAEMCAKQNNLHAIIEKIVNNNNMSISMVNDGNIAAQTLPSLGTAQKSASSHQTAVRTPSSQRLPLSTGWISKETPSRKRKSPVSVNNKENSKTPKVDSQQLRSFNLSKSLSDVNKESAAQDALLTVSRVGDTRTIRQGASTSRKPMTSTISTGESQKTPKESIIMIGNTGIKSTSQKPKGSISDASQKPRLPEETVRNKVQGAQMPPCPQSASFGNAPSISTSKEFTNNAGKKSVANQIQYVQTPRPQPSSVGIVSSIKQSASASKETVRGINNASKQPQAPINKQSASTLKEPNRRISDVSKQPLEKTVANRVQEAQTPRPQSSSVGNMSIGKQSASTPKELATKISDMSKQPLEKTVANFVPGAQTPCTQSSSISNSPSVPTSKELANNLSDTCKQPHAPKKLVANGVQEAQTPRPQSSSIGNGSISKQSASTPKELARRTSYVGKQPLEKTVANLVPGAQTSCTQSSSISNSPSVPTSKELANNLSDISKQPRPPKKLVTNGAQDAQTPRPKSSCADNVSIIKQKALSAKEPTGSRGDANQQSLPANKMVTNQVLNAQTHGNPSIASTSKEPANFTPGSSQIQQTPQKSALNEGAGPSGSKSSCSKGKSTCALGSSGSPSKGSPDKNGEAKTLKGKQGKQLQGQQLEKLKELFKIVASNRHLWALLNCDERGILKRFIKMDNNQKYFVMKLYVWQRKWYNIFKFCTKAGIQLEDDKEILRIFEVLSEAKFVDTDYRHSVGMVELLHELDVRKLKEVMNELRIIQKGSTKEDLISDVVVATSRQATLTNVSLTDKVMDRISMKLGRAIKIKDDVYNAFYHVCLLATFTNPDFVDIQQYFRSVIYDRVVFPAAPIEDYPVFYSSQKFKGYADALKRRSELDVCLTNKYQGNKYLAIYGIGEATYACLQNLGGDRDGEADHAKTPHLKRFTAEHVYVGVLTTCCEHVFSKQHGRPAKVKQWLEYLIETFPQSRRLGQWYQKLIWLHMRHLPSISYERGAQLLIEALHKKGHLLGERAKFELALLGEKLKASKKHQIEQGYHDRVAELVPKTINVSIFPHVQIDSQCIRSNVSGKKRVYVSRNDGETTMKYVEHVALDYYTKNGYPGGKHCEGSLMRALLMLYFWDLIYDPEQIVPATFISKFQKAPLDMGSPHFYLNRREAIDARLEQIRSSWSEEKFLKFGVDNFQNHSHECSAVGLVMHVIDDPATMEILVTVIGRRVLAGIFTRLIKNFRENSSGMPDLLVWNVDQKKHLFVEVKGEGDRLAPNQKLWLKYLQEIGASIQVCTVHSTGSKRKKIIANSTRSDAEG